MEKEGRVGKGGTVTEGRERVVKGRRGGRETERERRRELRGEGKGNASSPP